MGPERRVDVPIYDLTLIRGIWEVRVKKHRQRQKKEQERVEKSALPRIEQEWQYRINQQNLLHHHLDRLTLTDIHTSAEVYQQDQKAEVDQKDPEQSELVFQLNGAHWTDFPRELQWMTYLTEWHIRETKIRQLPAYLPQFTQLRLLNIPKNAITELPPEIGKLMVLKELNVSYNRLSRVPPELGTCEDLQRLELTGNHLSELPFELSSLKQLVHLDLAENKFASIPICTLRMSSLQLLDLSNNHLKDLPQDMDRLEQLVNLFLHKNNLFYLPHCLTNISTLKMIVVSGNELNDIPTRLCSNPAIKFIRLFDNDINKSEDEEEKRRRWREQQEVKDSGEKEFIETYIHSLMDRSTIPYATTKVSISCQL